MEVALILLVVLFGLNIFMTRQVSAVPDEFGVPKGMLIAGIWVLPFFGAWTALNHMPDMRRLSKPADDDMYIEPHREAAPAFVLESHPEQLRIHDVLVSSDGTPVMNWRSVEQWARRLAPGLEPRHAIDQARRAWLLHLRDALGPHYTLFETQDAYVLSSLEPHIARATAHYITVTKRHILRVLNGLAHFNAGERSVLIVFDSQEAYYEYVAVYYPAEGEFALSGGLYIDAGCPHFVMVNADLAHIEPVIAHELTHSAVAHLDLPKWLDEGIAVNTEQRITHVRSMLHTPRELHDMHLNFWTAEQIQAFWSGDSFDRTDDGNLLSYELARVIVDQLSKQWDAFARFARKSQPADAGAAAALEHMGIELGAVAATLMERQDTDGWRPDPSTWRHPQEPPAAVP